MITYLKNSELESDLREKVWSGENEFRVDA